MSLVIFSNSSASVPIAGGRGLKKKQEDMKKTYIKPEIVSVNVQTTTLLAGSIIVDANETNVGSNRIGGFDTDFIEVGEDW